MSLDHNLNHNINHNIESQHETEAAIKASEQTLGQFEKIAFIAVTAQGKTLAYCLQEQLGEGDIYVSPKLAEEGVTPFTASLKDEVAQLFKNYDALVFIMATGIVVRSIAPYLESKFTDPAVVVMDEQGQNVISLLSGHMGGANELTQLISEQIGAHPVITTATDVNKTAALDNIAKELNAYIADFRESVKDVNYALVHGEKVGLYIKDVPEYTIDTRGFVVLGQLDLEKGKGICENTRQEIQLQDLKLLVYITRNQLEGEVKQDIDQQVKQDTSEEVMTSKKEITLKEEITLKKEMMSSKEETAQVDVSVSQRLQHKDLPRIIKVIPRDLVLGMGCRRNTPTEQFIDSFNQFLNKHHIDAHAICKVASIDLKKDETAMQNLSKLLEVPFEIVERKDVLEVEELFEKSEFVKQHVGVYSVAEPVAYLLSGKQLLVHKEKHNGATFAVGKKLPKGRGTHKN